jgi:hypothetical protein
MSDNDEDVGSVAERKGVVVARPGRVGLKPMTVRVDPPTWRFFKKLAPDLDVTQERLLRRSLALFKLRFMRVPDSEYRALWEMTGKEIAEDR